MSFTFKPARRKGVHLILGLMGGTGSGKTYSALELATGLSRGKRFAVIDTEAGRSQHYADSFDFDHGDLAPPFSPDSYLEAIVAAEGAGYPVIVVDSMSHEHAGEGGILDIHEEELNRIAGTDYKKRERSKFLAWVKPKGQHKRMVARLLQLRTHLILCFRAEPKMKVVKVRKGERTVNEPVDAGWQPVCAKGLEFEMTASWMLRHERPGQVFDGQVDETDPIGAPIKLPEPLRPFFGGCQQISRAHGQQLAQWAAGGSTSEPARVVLEEYVEVGKLTRRQANEALVSADLKAPGQPISTDAGIDEIRAALEKALAGSASAPSNGRAGDPALDELQALVKEAGAEDAVAQEFGPPGAEWLLNTKAIWEMCK